MKKLKIAIVALPYISIPPKNYAGTERVIDVQIKGLMELGHDVILLAPGDSQVDCELIPICEHELPTAPDELQESRLEPLRKAALAKTIEELKKIRDRVDIIHSHGYCLKDFRDFPNLTTLHNPIHMEHRIDFFTMDYYEDKRRKGLPFVTVSKDQQKNMPHLNYMGQGYVYNGLDTEPFKLVKEPEDYFCFIGRVDPEKQPHMAVQLAIKLNTKIKVAIGKVDIDGQDYYNKKLKKYIDHPLVEDYGMLDINKKVELLSKAKCNLHPINFREPFGLTIIEAAYCGTPTLAIDKGSMSEVIEDGRTGILVQDFNEGVHRVKECFEMDREYISKRTKALFNYKKMANDYIKIYENVISKHHKTKV